MLYGYILHTFSKFIVNYSAKSFATSKMCFVLLINEIKSIVYTIFNNYLLFRLNDSNALKIVLLPALKDDLGKKLKFSIES